MYLLRIYLAAAILPAVALMIYVYKKDKAEQEPVGLLAWCLLMGVCAAFLAIALEVVGENALNFSGIQSGTPLYVMILAFLIVAVAEEGAKFLFLKLKTWKNPNFDYKFDGVVYAVFVSLGFAAFENVKYVFSYGLSVALPRAFLAIPGHASFAVLMGVFYARAKACHQKGDKVGQSINTALALIVPMLLHGAYDTCAMLSTNIASITFLAVIFVVYFIMFFVVRKEAQTDFKFTDAGSTPPENL